MDLHSRVHFLWRAHCGPTGRVRADRSCRLHRGMPSLLGGLRLLRTPAKHVSWVGQAQSQFKVERSVSKQPSVQFSKSERNGARGLERRQAQARPEWRLGPPTKKTHRHLSQSTATAATCRFASAAPPRRDDATLEAKEGDAARELAPLPPPPPPHPRPAASESFPPAPAAAAADDDDDDDDAFAPPALRGRPPRGGRPLGFRPAAVGDA